MRRCDWPASVGLGGRHEWNTQPSDKSNQPLGNAVLHEILENLCVPAVVYSGHVREASEEVTRSPIKLIDKKGGGAREALNWLAGHGPLMSALYETKNRIARESAVLFNQSIWPRWETAWRSQADSTELVGIISRQIASHVAEMMGSSPNHHPEECYFIPPLQSGRLDTGDLIKLSGGVHIVVTPRCNLANGTPDHILLAACKPVGSAWDEILSLCKGGDKNKIEKAKKRLSKLATQNHEQSSHFLPQCGSDGPWLVDFKNISSISAAEIAGLMESKFASLATQFIPNLVQRYAAYVGRIGQPELDCDAIAAKIIG